VFRFSLQLLSQTFLTLRRNERDMIENVYGSSCRVPAIFFQVLMKLQFSQNTQISNFINIRTLKAELFHAQVWTDIHDEANNRFSKFFEGA
jgi:fumarate reductase subunit C